MTLFARQPVARRVCSANKKAKIFKFTDGNTLIFHCYKRCHRADSCGYFENILGIILLEFLLVLDLVALILDVSKNI